ncbi:MAG: hypothetical protein R3F14_27340 [Polyangiaceae bacterium]
MKKLFGHALFLGLLALAAGCEKAPTTSTDDTEKVNVDPHANIPGFDSDADTRTSELRRLKLDMLQQSVPVIAGNDAAGNPIFWKVKISGVTVDGLSDKGYGKVLGRPDYIDVTTEQTAPSSLYMKLVRDMAQNVCDQMVKADIARAPEEERTLWRKAPIDGTATDAQVGENLAYLYLRFTGYRVEPTDPAVADLRQVYDDAVAGYEGMDPPAPAEGWRAVCVALFEDPALHLE